MYTGEHVDGWPETRTAALVAAQLSASGFEVTTGVDGTGVVALLHNGDGPLVLLRADMDGLPVEERTGLAYASVTRAVTDGGTEVPVMHACGHDVHVTCLLGACAVLSADSSSWSGTVFAVFQPAEELGAGAQAMVEDGLFELFGRPAVVLGQHVAPLPAGIIGLRRGAAFAAADTLSIVLHGRGGHGSRPEASVDPIVMAAATVMRLQTVVSRELAGSDTAVVTAAVERIVRGEAVAAGAPRDPEITVGPSFPAVVNDPDAPSLTQPALEAVSHTVVDPGTVTGSEDVGVLATAAGHRASSGSWAAPTPRGSAEQPRSKRSQRRCSSCHRTTPRCTHPRLSRPSTLVPRPSSPLLAIGSTEPDGGTARATLR